MKLFNKFRYRYKSNPAVDAKFVVSISDELENSFKILLEKLSLIADIAAQDGRAASLKELLSKEVNMAREAIVLRTLAEVDSYLKSIKDEPPVAIPNEKSEQASAE